MLNKISFFIGLVIFLTLASPAIAQEPVGPQHDDPNWHAYDSPGGPSTRLQFTSPMGYATVYNLNVRSGPGLDYKIKGRIYRGQPVLLLGRNGAATWLKIEAISGIEGWVYARYMYSNIPITELLVLHEPPTSPPANPVGYATVYRLNVRSGPSLNYNITGRLYRGQPVMMLGRNSAATWFKVETIPGFEGWVSANYIRSNIPIMELPVLQEPPAPPSANPVGYVTVYRLNFRSGPSLDYGIKGWLYRGQPVMLMGRNSTATWLKVETKSGFEGWVSANYIRSNIPITSLPVIQ